MFDDFTVLVSFMFRKSLAVMEKHYSHVVGLVSLLMIMVTIGYATDIEDNGKDTF